MPWELTGNAGTNPIRINPMPPPEYIGTDFLGTRDNQPLVIETNAAGIGNRPSVVIAPSNAPGIPRGFVGIGSENPQTQLNVESDNDVRRPTVHTGGPNAGYSFSVGLGFPPFRSATSGERWVWRPSPGNPASPKTDPPRAALWSFTDKLSVTSFGQTLLHGGVGSGEALFPQVPIGVHTKPSGTLPSPPTRPEPGELVLDGNRTSIRGFDGAPEDPARPLGSSLRLGNHWIRTNGLNLENWIGFDRTGYPGGLPHLNFLRRRLNAAVPWYGPSFNGSSDARLKTNVRQVEGALDKLDRIRGTAFEWAETESPYALGGPPGQTGIGVVAQEVEEVFPEVVSTYDVTYAEPDREDKEEYMAVDYNGLTSVLIEAVKELKAQNEALRSRIEALEGAQE
jgi:hypothetical protein